MKPDASEKRLTEEAIESLDRINRAEAPPYLYTRLMARLEQPMGEGFRIKRPAFSLALLTLLLVLNIILLSRFQAQKAVAGQETGIRQFAQEYDLNLYSVDTDNAAQ